MARTIWTGTLGFGLVDIPVSLHAAEERGEEEDAGRTDPDSARAIVEAMHRVDILDFVDFSAIDPRFVDRPYYLASNKAGRKDYALLRETLRRTGKAGIGKIVIRRRQHLCAIVAADKALLLILLRFAGELRDTSELDLPERNLAKLGVTQKELRTAERLVQRMATEFKPEKYEDDYRKPARQTRPPRGKPPRSDGNKNCA